MLDEKLQADLRAAGCECSRDDARRVRRLGREHCHTTDRLAALDHVWDADEFDLLENRQNHRELLLTSAASLMGADGVQFASSGVFVRTPQVSLVVAWRAAG